MTDGEIIIVSEGKHSPLGASGAHRWLNCPGSVELSKKAPEDALATSEPAAQGTAAHLIGSMCLEQDKDTWEYIGTIIEVEMYSFTVDEDMANAVQVYVDYVRETLAKYKDQGAYLLIEQEVSSVLDPDAWGTADAIIVVPDVLIIDIDYKHGRGVVCEPDSEQLMEYGYLVWEGLNTGHCAVHQVIVQPRIPHRKGVIRTFETTTEFLEKWFINTVLTGMQATREDEPLLNVGDWCRFCAAKSICPALKGEVVELNTDLTAEHLSDEELTLILKKAASIRKYLEQVEKMAFDRLMDGRIVQGYKLVAKKANRKWNDEVEAKLKRKFGKKAYSVPKLKSPAQIENLVGGKKFAKANAFSPKTGFTMAPEGDKRKAVGRPIDKFLEQQVV